MVTNDNGCSISGAAMTVLWINLVVNLYNLAIIWFNDSLATKKLLGYAIQTKQFIIATQTILTMCAIMVSSIRYTYFTSSVKFWVFGSTIMLLFADVMMSWTTAVELFWDKILDEFWRIKTNNEEIVAPKNVYLFAAYILLIYSVFKLYAAYKMFQFIMNPYLNSNEEDILNNENVERNTPPVQHVSLLLPPSYDRSIMESVPMQSLQSPPPPYSVIQKY